MKKNIVIGIALIGLILLFSSNSWAARREGAKHQKWDRHSSAIDKRDRSRSLAPGIQHHRPAHRFFPRLHRPDHHRAPYRFAPKYRLWRHRPFYRHFHPGRHFWQHRHGASKNNYYSNAERYYRPEDEFGASALISNIGVSAAVGVRQTN